MITNLLEEPWVVDEDAVDAALVAVEEPHHLVAVPDLDLPRSKIFRTDRWITSVHNHDGLCKCQCTSATTLVSQASLYWS